MDRHEKGPLVALAGPLKGCPDLDYLGLRLNWTDYTPRERDLILSARKVLFPTIHYARQFAALGIRTYPSAASYSLLGDKAAQSLLFQMAGIPTPRTRLFTGRNRKAKILEDFSFPFVAKVPKGASRGLGVFLIRDEEALDRYLEGSGTAYIQEYIPVERDIRVVILSGRIAHLYWKRAMGEEFRTNVARGGAISFEPVDEAVIELARTFCAKTGVDHAGLDICWWQRRALLFEANIHFGTEGFAAAGISYRRLLCSIIRKGEI